MAAPTLSGIVVHWHAEEALAALSAAAWPSDPRCELVVVDNGSRAPLALPEGARLVEPGRNLGFAGGANRGASEARGEALLVLKPRRRSRARGPRRLLDGSPPPCHSPRRGARAAPARTAGEEQCAWQLRPLAGAGRLLLHALFVGGPSTGPPRPPPPATAIAQPAAAALLLRRRRPVRAPAGLRQRTSSPRLVRRTGRPRARARAAGERFVYWPAAVFRHALGTSVGELGYGPFLVAYQTQPSPATPRQAPRRRGARRLRRRRAVRAGRPAPRAAAAAAAPRPLAPGGPRAGLARALGAPSPLAAAPPGPA